MMVVRRPEEGFTIIEMVVTLFVMTLFMTLLFQLFKTSESQRVSVVRRAAANDIALNNLSKIPKKTATPLPACTASNDRMTNSSAQPSIIVSNKASESPQWTTTTMQPEPLTGTPLASTNLGTVQRLYVIYPRGCDVDAPATIISTVEYGSGESVRRAAFIN